MDTEKGTNKDMSYNFLSKATVAIRLIKGAARGNCLLHQTFTMRHNADDHLFMSREIIGKPLVSSKFFEFRAQIWDMSTRHPLVLSFNEDNVEFLHIISST